MEDQFNKKYTSNTYMDINLAALTPAQQVIFSPIDSVPASLHNRQKFVVKSSFSNSWNLDTCQFQLTLTTNYILLTVVSNQQSSKPIAAVQISFDLKFELIYKQEKNMLSKKIGIRLFYSPQRSFSFYSQCAGAVESWNLFLGKKLNKGGFHDMFKPIKKQGKGGFASVFRVKRDTDGLEFAVKAFQKKKVFESQNGRESLINQVEIMRKLNHSNILKLFEVYESDNSIYLILELIKGGSLSDRIKGSKAKFTAEEVRGLMWGILEGLNHVHTARIAHRDVKLDNILLKQKGSLIPVIIDFGLATNVDLLKYIFSRCGTPGFVSPQILIIKESEHTEPNCDIFSTGAVFHHLLMGRPLFQVDSHVFERNMEMSFNLQKELYKSVDYQAMSLLRRMLEKDPEQRITTAQALKHPYFDTKEIFEHDPKIVSPSLTVFSRQPDIFRFQSPRKY